MGEGRLIVRLNTARDALPAGGTVEILGESGGGEGIALTLLTDASGVTQSVALPAPDASLSLDPTETAQPYGAYTVTVTATDFQSVVVRHVQIYDGVEADLPVDLIPYYETGLREIAKDISDEEVPTQVFEITPPAIRMARQSGDGPLVDCDAAQQPSPEVQSNVYIPQYITVHLGRPTAAATNLTVTFPNYIKNVCCSEIYPTWPENAIRANVYAQISLALNRVYTEWYVSKGYSFQITNSTQYDQYFVANRNIFTNISNIVDEIFNVYLRRVGDYAPYYAEYCNGTTVTCPGMSQWGTVALANSGLTPIQILRRYYGNNFELVETNEIRAIENSYPGTALSLGSTGNNVRIVQRQLARIARNYPAIGTVTVDGVFGAATQTAVRAFQRIFNLTQDGIVGKRTWYQISYIYVAVKKLAELGSENEPYPETGGGSGSGNTGGNLQLGNTGRDVAWLQYRLSYLSATFYPQITLLNPDGVFGTQTRTAVQNFQTLFGLTVDGIAGTATQARLQQEFLEAYEDNNPGSFFGAYPGIVFRLGDRGIRTKQMQFYLLYLSYAYSAIPRITADGVFGAATQAAVIAFQNKFGLVPDGVVGLQTWTELVSVFNQVQSQTLANEQMPDTAPGYTLREGSEGMAVRQIQMRLWAISRQQGGISPVLPTGSFDADTVRSVREFQRQYQLPVTGRVDQATWLAINDAFEQSQTSDDDDCRFVDVATPGRTLSQGDTGIYVRILSYYYNFAATFNLALDPLDDVTNTFTPALADGIRDFQRFKNLPVTGVVDDATWQALYEQYVADYRAAYQNCADVVEHTPNSTLYPGSSGARVTNLQLMINALAAYYCEVTLLDVTGVYDEETEADIIELQIILGLPANGITDPATWNAIYEAYTALENR